MTTSSSGHKTGAKLLFQEEINKSLTVDIFSERVWKRKLSGEARISQGKDEFSILFLRGRPILSSKQGGMAQTFELIRSSGGSVRFYFLDYDLAQSYSALLSGKRICNRLASSTTKMKKMLVDLKSKRITGVLGTYNSKDEQHYLFFKDGAHQGMYNVNDGWKMIEPAPTLQRAEAIDLYVAERLTALTSMVDKSVSEINSLIPTQHFGKFFSQWNDHVDQIAAKVSKVSSEISSKMKPTKKDQCKRLMTKLFGADVAAKIDRMEEEECVGKCKNMTIGFLGPEKAKEFDNIL